MVSSPHFFRSYVFLTVVQALFDRSFSLSAQAPDGFWNAMDSNYDTRKHYRKMVRKGERGKKGGVQE
jgi:hypothetical protein